MGATKNLRVSPEDRIEKAKAKMLHKRVQEKLMGNTQSQTTQLKLARLDEEYELLLQKIADYYAAKKRLIDLKKKKLLKHYESFEFLQQYKEMKSMLEEQRKSWHRLTAQYA